MAKLEGQIGGIRRMVEYNRPQEEISQQVASTISGLQELAWLTIVTRLDAANDPAMDNERRMALDTIGTLLRLARRT